MHELNIPVDLVWGKKDPWEPISEAHNWKETIPCIESMSVIAQAGHCPHDETPNEVNLVLTKLIKNK